MFAPSWYIVTCIELATTSIACLDVESQGTRLSIADESLQVLMTPVNEILSIPVPMPMLLDNFANGGIICQALIIC
jgi:hypothetical protein